MPTAPKRSLTYSLLVKGAAGEQEIAPDAVPRSGALMKFQFSSPQDGYLYLVARGPSTANGRTWTWLFPEPGYQNGSGEIAADRMTKIPTPPGSYIQLDSLPGQETVYIVWSEKPLEQIENIKQALFVRLMHSVNNPQADHEPDSLTPGEVETMEAVIRQASKSSVEQRRMATYVRSDGPTVVTSFTLGHL
jgi:hypothetical protein